MNLTPARRKALRTATEQRVHEVAISNGGALISRRIYFGEKGDADLHAQTALRDGSAVRQQSFTIPKTAHGLAALLNEVTVTATAQGIEMIKQAAKGE